MALREIHVQGFRSLRDVRIQFQDRLTILVGENNTGKTALLDIIDLVLNSCDAKAASKIPVDESKVIRQPDLADYIRGGNSEIMVSLTFEKREGDEFEEDAFKVYYRPNQRPVFYQGRWGQIKERGEFMLYYDKRNIRRPKQDSEIEWKPIELLPEYVDDPDVRCYSLADYANTIVRYFRPPYLQHLQRPLLRWIQDNLPQEGEITALWQRLQELLQRHAQDFLDQSGLLQHLQAMLHGIPIEFKPKFCDYNDLLQEGIWYFDRTPLSKMGKGVQQLLSLGIIEWWIQQVHEDENTDILLLLDEPDTFLHFEAQRYFFRKLKEIVLSYPFLQVIMSTHSVVMIDAADVRQIVRFSKNDKGETEIRYITTSTEEEVYEFLSNIASLLGITNSSLLYQRCFVVVEGETERTFLSLLYKKLFGRSLQEDGLVIVPLKGVGKAETILQLLSEQWQLQTLLFVDRDAQQDLHNRLIRLGWPPEQIEKSFYVIGEQEFEDAFSDEVWARALNLNSNWKRKDHRLWSPQDIAKARKHKKFSKGLQALIHESAGVKYRDISKPMLAYYLAHALEEDEIPMEILELFNHAREVSGVEQAYLKFFGLSE